MENIHILKTGKATEVKEAECQDAKIEKGFSILCVPGEQELTKHLAVIFHDEASLQGFNFCESPSLLRANSLPLAIQVKFIKYIV